MITSFGEEHVESYEEINGDPGSVRVDEQRPGCIGQYAGGDLTATGAW